MLYTGTSRLDRGLVQRIGLARSDDLTLWTKHHGNPVLEADSRWYETLDLDAWFDQAWRDPHVVRDPDTGIFHAFLTARAATGSPQQRGVIGHATSPDLINWAVAAPIQGPAGYGYMEVPQVIQLDQRWHLLFSAPAWAQAARSRPHCTGTFHAVADRITGPYVELEPLFCDDQQSLYGGKLIGDAAGLWCLAFRYLDEAGRFVGQLTDPMPVTLTATEELVLT
jgi:beta-fructofuranosidase